MFCHVRIINLISPVPYIYLNVCIEINIHNRDIGYNIIFSTNSDNSNVF